MDLSSLPKHPVPSPPTGGEDGLAPAPRGRTMLLQFLFLVAIWGGIYTLRQQSLAFEEAERRRSIAFAEAERRRAEAKLIEGKWESTHGGGVVLELRAGRFTLEQDGEEILFGKYERSADRLDLWIRVPSGIAGYWSPRYRFTADELEVWNDSDRVWIGFLWKLGPEAVEHGQTEADPLRFRRVGE